MTENPLSLGERLQQSLGDRIQSLITERDEITLEIAADHWVDVSRSLRDDHGFEQLVDLCGVDYLGYGSDEWETGDATAEGFSRGVEGSHGPGRFDWESRPVGESTGEGDDQRRFAAVAHLLSVKQNLRLRIRCFAPDSDLPVVPSLVEIWSSVDWYEREAFDLFGIVFEGHPDLRRILTDYGFIGHPFRKDFPLIGNVEARYDPDKGRVVYQPVSIDPRVLVPKVVREDSRYLGEETVKGK
ncbi:MAG: NADH-quinone oxidoreductase subunit C [Xanthomonadales bacterium]|nr:NADH-quinone oxidoreductase subunit C [Xanthomonadales bacterium]